MARINHKQRENKQTGSLRSSMLQNCKVYSVGRRAGREMTPDKTQRANLAAAKREIDNFCRWREENHLQQIYTKKDLQTDPVKAAECVQRYYDEVLLVTNKRVSTANNYVKHLAKGLCIETRSERMKSEGRLPGVVIKPDDSPPTRGRGNEPIPNTPLTSFANMVGIRRAEYEKLAALCLKTDESGYLCIEVVDGKGGKHQLQRVLPDDVGAVSSMLAKRRDGEKVFSMEEMDKDLNLHRIRAEQAQRAYWYYHDLMKADPEYRNQLREEMYARYRAENGSNAKIPKDYYLNLSVRGPIIRLRAGGNMEAAHCNGWGTELDRMAVMAVSVFHLSHWRTDVTMKHYLLSYPCNR